MKRIITFICMMVLLAFPMTCNADAGEKTVPVEARKAFNEKEFSMANAALNHEAVVVEQPDGKYKYTIMTKPIKIGGVYGQLVKLFVYDGDRKIELTKESVTGEYNAKFTFIAPRSEKIRFAVWVDAMDEIAGGGPGSGEQDVLFCFNWAKAHDKASDVGSAGIVKTPVGKDPIQVFVYGSKLSFDAQPFIKEGRTLVPMRAIFEAIGAEVKWDAQTRTAIAEKDGTVVKVKIDSIQGIIEKNGKTDIKSLDVSAMIKDGRTFVPLRFIGEAFDNKVHYEQISGIKMINVAK